MGSIIDFFKTIWFLITYDPPPPNACNIDNNWCGPTYPPEHYNRLQ